MTETNLTIHIGLPRTGSKLLQKHLFSHHSQLTYLGSKKFATVDVDGRINDLSQAVRSLEDDEFETRKPAFVTTCSEIVDPLLGAGNRAVLSDEGFTTGRLVPVEERARRLGELFGSARILLVIRHPHSHLKSFYLQIVRGRQSKKISGSIRKDEKLPDFVTWLNLQWDGPPQFRRLDYLDHYGIATSYSRYFGRENVFIVPFELLHRDWDRFVESISAVIGVDPAESKRLLASKSENAGLTERAYWERNVRLGNRWVHKAYSLLPGRLKARFAPPDRPMSDALEIPADTAARFDELWRNRNRQLMTEWELPLDQLGYPV